LLLWLKHASVLKGFFLTGFYAFLLKCPIIICAAGPVYRYMSAGRALLMLTPVEAQGMLAAMAAAKIPYKPLKINPAKQQAIGPALQALLSKNAQLKVSAHKLVALWLPLAMVWIVPAFALCSASTELALRCIMQHVCPTHHVPFTFCADCFRELLVQPTTTLNVTSHSM
jgi:hypothetical protein